MLKAGGQDPKKNLIQFYIELFFAILLSVGCGLIGMSNLLWTSNDLLPSQTDLLGHVTKVLYLAEQLSEGHLPSWFPYWYNGSTTTQYYVPLSYYIMLPIYLVTHNIMLTYKIFCVSLMSIGSIGVWTFCYQKIGRGCGLIGIITFSLQPILLESLYREGVIAQAPIFALMPWFLLLILSCAQKPTKRKFIFTTILVTLLILSHAMLAYMICLSTLIVLFVFVLRSKISLRKFIVTSCTIVLSGLLTAFWSLVGATGLENPGIPYLLPEAAHDKTATLQWFIPNAENAYFYFSILVTVLCCIGVLCYFVREILKKNSENIRYYVQASLILTFVTVIISFGYQIPVFQFIPMASGLVPGRLLTFTCVTGAISSAYCMYLFWNFAKIRIIRRPLTITFLIILSTQLNPFVRTYPYTDNKSFNLMTEVINNKADAFDKGRYNWYGVLNSSEVLFSYLSDYNLSNGWNIEGTIQNQAIYNNGIALPAKEYKYIEKEIAFWNTRYLLLNNEYIGMANMLQNDLGFHKSEGNREGFTLYTSNLPSNYYLIDHRNALIVSKGMQGLSISYPNLVQGKSENLWDYSMEELKDYRLIYIVEPAINTRTEQNKFEDMVTILVNAGVQVIIEPSPSNIFHIFGVQAKDELCDTSPILSPTEDCPYQIQDIIIEKNSYYSRIRGLYGLDKEYAKFTFDNNDIQTDIIGGKKVGNGEVVFVGAHLSQYLSGVYVRNNGLAAWDDTIKENNERVKLIFDQLLDYYDVNANFLPESFEAVTDHEWTYDGGEFTYDSDQANEVTVSVTYSPRWTALIDGSVIPLGEKEHLITLDLPAGKHTVELRYVITVYGKIGYLISGIGMVLFLLFLLFWKKVNKIIDNISNGFLVYLQIKAPGSIQDKILEKENSADISDMDSISSTMEVITPMTDIKPDEMNKIQSSQQVTDQPQEEQPLFISKEEGMISRELCYDDGLLIDIIEIEGESDDIPVTVTASNEVGQNDLSGQLELSEMEAAATINNDSDIYTNEEDSLIINNSEEQTVKDESEETDILSDNITTEVIIFNNTGVANEMEGEILSKEHKTFIEEIDNPEELDTILKTAIYLNERNKLMEYQEYLKERIIQRDKEVSRQ